MLNAEFLLRMQEYLGADYQAFLDSYQAENIRGLRINANYMNEQKFAELSNFSTKKIANIPNAYVVGEEVKFGFHPLHHAGAFYLQDPSAMIPALSAHLQSNFKVLDLCAAPGGKSTQLAEILKDGVLFANEIDTKRAWSLYSNVERLGFKNVVVTNNCPKDYLQSFQGYFDAILVDAPCSGEGMFRKYPESQALWSSDNIKVCAERDKEILTIANKLLKKDGILIYSTCTFAKEENEEIVTFMQKELGYDSLKIKETLLPCVRKGFIENTYRIYPQDGFGEGQFVAVLKKQDDEKTNYKQIKFSNTPKEFKEFCDKALIKSIDNLLVCKEDIFYCASNVACNGLKVLNYGVKLGKIQNKRFIPEHHFFKAFYQEFINQVNLSFKDSLVTKYLHGEQINYEVKNGFGVLLVDGIPLGGFKASNNNLNNHYPKGLRNY